MTEDPSLPSLVLLPGLDGTGKLFTEFVQWIVDTARNARLVEIDGPHLLLQTCPEECAAAVMRFMRTLG